MDSSFRRGPESGPRQLARRCSTQQQLGDALVQARQEFEFVESDRFVDLVYRCVDRPEFDDPAPRRSFNGASQFVLEGHALSWPSDDRGRDAVEICRASASLAAVGIGNRSGCPTILVNNPD